MPDALPTRICAIIRDELAAQHWTRRYPDIEPDTMLADVDCDPLDRLCITCALDEAFGTAIPDSALEGWESVGDVVATVRELVGEAA